MKQKDMRTNSLNNSFSLLNYKNLNSIGRYIATIAAVLFLAIPQAWGADRVNAHLKGTVKEGSGGVYVASPSTATKPAKANTDFAVVGSAPNPSTKLAEQTYHIWAEPDSGYYFTEWSYTSSSKEGASITLGNLESAETTVTCNSATWKRILGTNYYTYDARYQTKPASGWTSPAEYDYFYDYTVSASFSPYTVTAANTHDDLTLTNLKDTTTGRATFTISPAFPTASSSDFQATWTSHWGTGKIDEITVDGTTVTVDYSFTGNGSFGCDHKDTLTLVSKGDKGNGKSAAIAIGYDVKKTISVGETKLEGLSSPWSEADGSATFSVKYACGANDFTASISDTTRGTWSLGTLSFKSTEVATGTGVITVPFTFCANGEYGDFSAKLTLTPVGSGEAKTITVTASVEPPVDYDVEVYDASGVKISEDSKATWAYGLDLANKNAGSTLKLMRDIDLGTITATNNITQAITIDLNGKELRAAVNATSVGVLTITAAVPVTIKDSKTGGKIINEIARNSEIRTIFVNKAGATLTLKSGTIAVNNLGQYASAAATVDGVAVAKYASCTARAIHQNAGTTVNINGGRVEAHGTRSVYGIVQGSNVATNKAGTTVLNITGGEIYTEGPYSIIGVYAYGKVNFSGGTINTHVTTDMVDARYAATATENKYNGYGYGIRLEPSANADETKCYAGILNMTGGTINVTNDRSYNGNYPNYGVMFNASAANILSGDTATDGSMGQKASATGSITGGEINVTSGTQYSHGVYVLGSYNSYDSTHHVVQIKNCKITSKAYACAYGVSAWAGINTTNGGCYSGNVEITDCKIYCESLNTTSPSPVYVHATSATIFQDGTTTNPALYHGEYAVAGKATINSGTFTSLSKTSSAYGAATSTRAKTVYSDETTVAANRKLGGKAEAYPILIIHGGTFKATSTTTTARAVSSGGYTTIDGGTFEAYATTTTAQGLYAVSGKLTATGVRVAVDAVVDAVVDELTQTDLVDLLVLVDGGDDRRNDADDFLTHM